MNTYTDADVEAALGAYILHGANHGPKAVVNDRMAAILDAVAPAIASRALREFAALVDSSVPNPDTDEGWDTNDMRARADDIEAGL